PARGSAVAKTIGRDSATRATLTEAPIVAESVPSRSAAASISPRLVVKAPALRPGDQLSADALAAHQAGQLDRAQELYEAALSSKPVSPDTYNNYGVLLMQRGDASAAIRMYRLATAVD